MTVMRSAALGFALALGATGAHAQSVVTRHVDNEPVETIVTQSPAGTVVTRRPLAAAPVDTTYVDEAVGVAPARHRVHHVHRATTERTVTNTERTHTERTHTARTRTERITRRVATSRPLVLAPAQRQVIYRTLVQERVVPRVMPRVAVAPDVVPSVPGYPPFPPPAYPSRAGVVAPATTGYGVASPVEDVAAEDEDDGYSYGAAPVGAAQIYPVGAVLPARVAVAPLPAGIVADVPAAQPYSYATVDGRVLLVDPVSNTVVADITP